MCNKFLIVENIFKFPFNNRNIITMRKKLLFNKSNLLFNNRSKFPLIIIFILL